MESATDEIKAGWKKFNGAAKRMEKAISELAEGPEDWRSIDKNTMRAMNRLFALSDARCFGGDAAASDAAYARCAELAGQRNAARERGSKLYLLRCGARADLAIERERAEREAGMPIELRQWARELKLSRAGV